MTKPISQPSTGPWHERRKVNMLSAWSCRFSSIDSKRSIVFTGQAVQSDPNLSCFGVVHVDVSPRCPFFCEHVGVWGFGRSNMKIVCPHCALLTGITTPALLGTFSIFSTRNVVDDWYISTTYVYIRGTAQSQQIFLNLKEHVTLSETNAAPQNRPPQ